MSGGQISSAECVSPHIEPEQPKGQQSSAAATDIGVIATVTIATSITTVSTDPSLKTDRCVMLASSLVTNVTNRSLNDIAFHLLSGRDHDLSISPPFQSD